MYRGLSQTLSPWQNRNNRLNSSKECNSKVVLLVPLSKSQGRFFFEDYLRESAQPAAGLQRMVEGSVRPETEEEVEVRLQRVEGVLFISRESLTTRRLAQLAGLADATEARTLIRRLNERYERVGRAFRIEEVGGGFEMLTKPQFAPWLRRLGHVPPEERLTAAAMEVLAIIAYRQPVMRADIEAIRGVSSEEVLKQLLSRDLVRISGRSEELGRPYLYGTTKRFLKMFGLKSLEKLPRADWINETWDVEELPDESSGIQEGGSDPGSPTLFSSQSMNNNGSSTNRSSNNGSKRTRANSETSQGLQESQDLVDNRISQNDTRTDSRVNDRSVDRCVDRSVDNSKVNSVDLQPGTDTKESIVKLANSAIGLAFESEENLEEQLAVASRLASIPVAVDEDEDEDFEDDDEEYEDEEDEDFEDYEDEEDEDLDEDLDEDFEDEDEAEDEESFEDEDEDEWEEVDEEDDEAEEDEEDEEWDDEDDDDWDDDEEEEEEEEDWE